MSYNILAVTLLSSEMLSGLNSPEVKVEGSLIHHTFYRRLHSQAVNDGLKANPESFDSSPNITPMVLFSIANIITSYCRYGGREVKEFPPTAHKENGFGGEATFLGSFVPTAKTHVVS
jgi:hypothetical protein